MKHDEGTLQRNCVKWFRLQYPEPKYIIFAIPNGGQRNRITAAIMKGDGVRAGIPDLCIISDRRILFIEMKAEKGRLSDNQKEVFAMIVANGFMVAVVNSFELFVETVERWVNML